MIREHSVALPVGHRLEEYEIVRLLGQGGFGITYLAKDNYRDEEVALKEYFPNGKALRTGGMHLGPSPGSRETFDWGYRRFLDEAQMQAKFRHPNIPALHRYFRANGTAYVAMEYIQGPSLAEVLAERGSLPLDEWRPWLDRLLDALEHVHGHDCLHRDITLGNILIREADAQPVLIDFGAARVAAGERTRTVVLTEAYAPIEQRSEKARQGPFTDIYSVAAVTYRALTGETPVSPADRAAGEEYQPLAQRLREPDDVLATLDRALALRPNERPPTVAGWRKALNEAAAEMWLRGEPATARDAEGMTALHRAAEAEPLPAVLTVLMEYGADVDATNSAGETPLHRAAAKNPNADVVTLLLDRGAKTYAGDSDGNTPLHAAVRHNPDLTILKALLDHGTSTNVRNEAGATPLHVAAELDSVEASQLLLDSGSHVRPLVPFEGWRSYGIPTWRKPRHERFRWFHYFSHDLAAGLTRDVPVDRYDPALAVWLLTGEYHHTSGWGEATALHAAAENGADGVTNLLLDRGADPVAKDLTGATPLHRAARSDAVDVVELLIREGADVGLEDAAGRTPLHFAAWGNSTKTTELLLRHGATFQASDEQTRVPSPWWEDGIRARDVLSLLLGFQVYSQEADSRTNDAAQSAGSDWANLRCVAEMLLHKGNTPLHWAAFGDSREVAELLLDEGADVHCSKSESLTPLDFAALGNAARVANLLLDRGADVRGRGGYSRTPLHYAALRNARETMEVLIDRGADPVARPRGRPGNGGSFSDGPESGATPMFSAAVGNARQAMELLVAQGAEIGSGNTSKVLGRWADWRETREGVPVPNAESRGGTLLHWASVRDAADVVEFLLDRGLDAEATDEDGRTPLDYAAQGDAVRTAQRLLDRGVDVAGSPGADGTPLHRASRAGATEVARCLLRRDADPEARQSDGGTVLHVVRDAATASVLLDGGAEVGARDSGGRTPLHTTRSEEVARTLLKHGADVKAADSDGDTPLHRAALRGPDRLVELLLNRDAPVGDTNHAGDTALHIAARRDEWTEGETRKAVVLALLRHGADANVVNQAGDTALHLAMRGEEWPEWEDRKAVVLALLKHGADAGVVNHAGDTALHLAIEGEVWTIWEDGDAVVLALLEHGADVTVVNKEGTTPMRMAMGFGAPTSVLVRLIQHGAVGSPFLWTPKLRSR